ncbi:MAG: tetratricopeptide repeat protein [Bryobacteraceae bacterium]|jgi:tetratricopeptide (TPR) repeat protein
MLRLLGLAIIVCASLRAETVVVLRFFNHANSAGLDWIGESIAETVQDALSSEGLLVLSREARTEAYRRLSLRPGAELTHASIIKVGDALDAARVVYGYYELLPAEGGAASKGSLRVTARVLYLKETRQGPLFSELGALEELEEIEARLGWQTLRQLDPRSVTSEEDFLKVRPPVRIDAVENYVRGLLATDPEQRQHLFMQAARLDEHYSPPCFQLGKSYWEKREYKVAAGWLARVGPFDRRYLEAQFFLGLCRYHSEDYAGARQSFQVVAGTMPLNEVFNNLGAAEARLNDYEAAAASFRKALEGDSADPDYHFNLGYTEWRAGQYPAAAESFRAALDRAPEDREATLMLDRSLKGEGARPGEPRLEDRVRVKTNYNEEAYRQLQAELKK